MSFFQIDNTTILGNTTLHLTFNKQKGIANVKKQNTH